MTSWRPYAASLAVAVIFSAHYLVARHVLTFMEPVALAAARGLVGGVVLAVVLRRSLAAHLSARRLLLLAAVAALGFCLNQLLFLEGLTRTTPADAALVSATIPLVSALLGAGLGLEPRSWRRLAGSALGLVAVGAYLVRLHHIALHDHVTGNAMIFANVLCFCGALVLVKRSAAEIPAQVVTAVMLLAGGAGLALVAGGSLGAVWTYSVSSPAAAAMMLFETVVTTAAGYGLNLWALKRLSLATTTVFNYLQTPLTALMAWAVLGAVPDATLPLAFVGIVAACVLVVRGSKA